MRADLERLFRAYSAVLALALDPPPSIRAPKWLPADRVITLALFKLRPGFSRSTFVVRHIRRNVGVIERGYSRRVATGQHDDDDELELIRHFKDSLSPAPPRWAAFSAVIAAILLAQTLFSAFSAVGPNLFQPLDLNLTGIANSDASSIYDLGRTLADASSLQLVTLLSALSLACYLMLRGPISGFRIARMLLNAPRALTRRNRNSALAAQAKHWDVYGQEERLLTALGQPRPRDPPLDLLVKTALLAAAWFYCVEYGWQDGAEFLKSLRIMPELVDLEVVSPLEVLYIAFLGAAITAAPPRLVWLSVAALRRRQGIMLLIAIAAVIPVSIVADDEALVAADPERAVRALVEESRTAEGLARAIAPAVFPESGDATDGVYDIVQPVRVRGVNLRGRNMNHINLRGVDFKGAQLSDANLAFSKLADSCLQHAVLRNANLSGADLRFADLRGSDLRGANLHGAKLKNSGYDARTRWPAGYPGRSGSRRAQRTDRSRCGLDEQILLMPGRDWVGGSARSNAFQAGP